MSLGLIDRDTRSGHPLDLVERAMSLREIAAERTDRNELVAEATGRWCAYHMVYCWSDEIGALHLSCAFDMRTPRERRAAVHELLALANDRLWVGHFDITGDEGMPAFRHALLLRGGALSAEQIEDLFDIAVSEIDRFYPAFQYVVWGGRGVHEALEYAILETQGEA